MADIFISYSRRDSEQALSLAERLRSYGASVWLDTASLAAAETWSAEIVTAIEQCSTFIILLSNDSASSHNVTKELSLASESKKRIVPIELYPCELNQAMKYALAGVQKVSILDEEALRRAFSKLLIPFEANPSQSVKESAPAPKKHSGLIRFGIPLLVLIAAGIGSYFLFFRTSERVASPIESMISDRTIVVLPFESLSAEKEDEYFADGLTSQIIPRVSRFDGVPITYRKNSKSYKGEKTDIKEMNAEACVKYVIDGTVQKQGKNIKINVQVISTETGKTLLSEPFEGTTDDLLGLQEKLARSIAFELQISLSNQDFIKTDARKGTNSNEAYNVFLKGLGAIENVKTYEDVISSEKILEQATTIDPHFLYPYYYRAFGHLQLFTGIGTRFGWKGNNPRDLAIADSLAKVMYNLEPKFADNYIIMARIALSRDSSEVAIKHLKQYMQLSPDGYAAYVMLGTLYYTKRDFMSATMYLEKAVEKNIADLNSYTLLISGLSAIGDTIKLNKYVGLSIPLYERLLEKNPMLVSVRCNYALNLAYAPAQHENARKQLELVVSSPYVTPVDLYNAGCGYARLRDAKKAVEMLKRSAEKGYSIEAGIQTDPDLFPIKESPEFKELLKQIHAK